MVKSNIINVKDCVAWWVAQVGKPCGKTNEYSAFMDSYKFYNYPKNGVANSCAIFYDTAIMKNMIPSPNADKARAELYIIRARLLIGTIRGFMLLRVILMGVW